MTAIIVYFNGTFVHRRNGAHKRVLDLLAFLSRNGFHLVIYSYGDHPDCPWGTRERKILLQLFPDAELYIDHRSRLFQKLVRAKKLATSLFPALASRLLSLRVPGATPNYLRMCRAYRDATLIINYANGLLELNGLAHCHFAIETHDLDFIQFSQRFGHRLTSRKIIGKFRSEFALLDAAPALISIAAPETGLFRLCFPNKRVFFVPDYGLHDGGAPADDEPTRDYDMVFVGSDNAFNVRGLSQFIIDHRDGLENRRLAIAGAVGTVAGIREVCAGLPGITLLGHVDDIFDLHRRSKMAISPVGGTGLKMKVLEALAAGRAVFGSQHTIDGLPAGSDACVFPIAWPAITAFLDNPIAQAVANRAARSYFDRLSSASDRCKLLAFVQRNSTCREPGPGDGTAGEVQASPRGADRLPAPSL